MTRQEMFDKAVRGLASQGWKHSAQEGRLRYWGLPPVAECRYRGPEGTKCAVGHLIPDELYAPEMEGAGALAGEVSTVLHEVFGEDLDLTFLSLLQQCHDESFRASRSKGAIFYGDPDLKKAMKDFASKNKLVWPSDLE